MEGYKNKSKWESRLFAFINPQDYSIKDVIVCCEEDLRHIKGILNKRKNELRKQGKYISPADTVCRDDIISPKLYEDYDNMGNRITKLKEAISVLSEENINVTDSNNKLNLLTNEQKELQKKIEKKEEEWQIIFENALIFLLKESGWEHNGDYTEIGFTGFGFIIVYYDDGIYRIDYESKRYTREGYGAFDIETDWEYYGEGYEVEEII